MLVDHRLLSSKFFGHLSVLGLLGDLDGHFASVPTVSLPHVLCRDNMLPSALISDATVEARLTWNRFRAFHLLHRASLA